MLRGRSLAGTALLVAVALGASPAAATDPTIGNSCASVGQGGLSARYDNGNNTWCNGSTYQYPAYQFGSSAATCNGTNAGIVQWTGSIFEGCNGSSWVTITNSVSNAYGQTMVSGWPDAISCNVTSPSLGTTIFYAAQMPYSADSLYHYRYSSSGTNYDVEFTSAGAFSAYANLTTTNCNVSISSLYTAGQAFNFVNGTSSAAYSPTAPAGSGYFVMTGTQWNGNLGGRTGADALCYTELTSTNTSWKGYSTASANGYLTTANIHAFVCDATCNNLMPLTTYNFAVANNAAAGGATFTTDSNGIGPNDSANWSAANYFASTYNYWTGRSSTGTNTTWSPNAATTNNCTAMTSSLSSVLSANGISSSTTLSRWSATAIACNNTLNLICYVNP